MYSCKHPGSIWSHLFLCGFSISTCMEWLLLWMGELEEGQVGPSSKWATHTNPEVWVSQCGQQKCHYSSRHPCPTLLTPVMSDHRPLLLTALRCVRDKWCGSSPGQPQTDNFLPSPFSFPNQRCSGKAKAATGERGHPPCAESGKCPPAGDLQCCYLPSWCS